MEASQQWLSEEELPQDVMCAALAFWKNKFEEEDMSRGTKEIVSELRQQDTRHLKQKYNHSQLAKFCLDALLEAWKK